MDPQSRPHEHRRHSRFSDRILLVLHTYILIRGEWPWLLTMSFKGSITATATADTVQPIALTAKECLTSAR